MSEEIYRRSQNNQNFEEQTESLSRTKINKMRQEQDEISKTNNLKVKLNKIIAGLVLAILIVYLILIFVNF
ncbi:hypothetical protein FC40_GL000863 [Ligilactobacillus hayakitensis DSM 18933 = JCM 14209]|uniref:Uncharacterized protein n=1 Tax=Ligilactobacillus hayakitensis DSM 18933 = JCM 14209 TaxID=1423755 RepID=A0A0R1WMP7_9LACO|nr:hypothetical protein [Ligilactobacillus hayakitensis]KRM19074.1 hypothetical protein FC40_GL000863 [Ligilactobacillus hayakitensis DSM 18933 = JCM 14209]